MRLRSTALLIAAAAVLLTACSTGSDETPTSPGGQPSASEPAQSAPAETPEAETPEPETSESAAAGACEYVPEPGAVREVDAPPADPTVWGSLVATISTSAGDIAVTLDAEKTTCTTNSFASLASQQYFDDTQCHRLTTAGIYVLQCGDPSATGMGGPGYSYADELDGTETYPAGTVAMANAGPDTNGSQFFLVYKDSMLPPSYTVFGQMDDAGLQVVQDIAATGVANGATDGSPLEPVTITSVTVK